MLTNNWQFEQMNKQSINNCHEMRTNQQQSTSEYFRPRTKNTDKLQEDKADEWGSWRQ